MPYLFQLPPVMHGFIFEDFSVTKSNVDEYSVLAPNLWVEMFTMFELTPDVAARLFLLLNC